MGDQRQYRSSSKQKRIHSPMATAHDTVQHEHQSDEPHLLDFQRTIGNRALQRLLASKKAVANEITAPFIQRFGESEHKRIGDDATRDASGNLQMVELAPGYSVTYGDMVAMAGDHFQDIKQMRDFAKVNGKGPGTRGEIEYVLWDIHGKPKPKPNKWTDKAEEEADKRYYALAANNPAHFLNPKEGDEQRSTVEKSNDLTKTKAPLNAVAGYSHNHIEAIKEAFDAGKAGKGIEAALAVEAFGAHFLTDAFASGHLRTPRASAKEYWNEKLPMFNFNLKGYVAEKIAEEAEETMYGGVLTEDTVYHRALSDVTKMVDKKGPITFGEIVSGALHDYDNEKGVLATVEGHQQPIRFMGDGKLGKEQEKKNGKLTGKWVDKPGIDEQEQIMMDAVKAGKDDIVKAWDAGKNSKSKVAMVELIDALTAGDGRFPAERLLPKPDFTNQPKWKFPDWETLLSDGQFKEGLKITIKDKASDFKKFIATEKDAKKRAAIQNKIITPLEADPFQVIKDVINWVPNTGGGWTGQNQDDNSEDYYEQAKKMGAVKSLTKEQRRKIIVNLFNGYTDGGDEARCMDLLNSAPDKDARYVIRNIGWGRMEDELSGKFSKKYPKAQYGGK